MSAGRGGRSGGVRAVRGTSRRPRGRVLWLFGLGAALLVAGALSFYASASPDGLERVAADLGFAAAGADHPLGSGPLADYQVAGIADGRLAGGLAGVAGSGVVLAVASGLALLLRRRPQPTRHTSAAERPETPRSIGTP